MKGRTVYIYEKVKKGEDPFGAPIYREIRTKVENVLIGQPTTAPITDSQNIQGKRGVFRLGIPKKDNHVWEDKTVEFELFGRVYKCKTIGFASVGQSELIPGPWKGYIEAEYYG